MKDSEARLRFAAIEFLDATPARYGKTARQKLLDVLYSDTARTPPQKAGGPDWDAPGSMRPPLRSEAEIELASIDELLARRPALADCKTRYDKIAFALRTAARAPEEAQKQGDAP